jgi:hypothetical protein
MTFALDMQKFVDKANKNIGTCVKQTVMEIGNRVVYRSPVGDATKWDAAFIKSATNLGWIGAGYAGGRFRANWQYGFNSIPSGDLPDIDASGAVSNGRIEDGVFASPVAGVHYITNNLPYAQRLEDGYSKQAPSGMVGLVMMEAPAIIDEIASKFK